jgi:hypothetical protein
MTHTLLMSIVLLASSLTMASGMEVDFAPDQSNLPVPPPKDAVMLLGPGKNEFLSMAGGKLNWPAKNDELVSTHGGSNTNHAVSRYHFRDADIHVEFMLPEKSSGNSGVYIHGNYELQIINSFGKQDPGEEDEGALYGFHKPLANACRKPGEWQVYDIRYRAPRRGKDGKILEEGSITAWLNGMKVQDNARFGEPRSAFHPYRHGTTPYLQTIWKRQKETAVGPVFLQDHSSPVRFRNVWIRPLDDKAGFYKPGQK